MSDNRLLPRSGNNVRVNPVAGFDYTNPQHWFIGANLVGQAYRNVARPAYDTLKYIGVVGDDKSDSREDKQEREYIQQRYPSSNPNKVRKLQERMKRKATPAQEFTATSHSMAKNVRTGGWPPCPPCKQSDSELKFTDWESTKTTYTGDPDPTYDTKLSGGPVRLEHSTAAVSLTSIAVGTGPNQRIGRKVMLVSLDIEAMVWPINESIGALSNKLMNDMLNFCVVLDTQTNGAYPNAIDIFKLSGTSSTMCKPNLFNSTRFKILKWKRKPVNFRVDTSGAIHYATITSDPHIKSRVNLNIPSTFTEDQPGQNIANIRDNSVHIFAWLTNQNNAGLFKPVCEINVLSRLRFTDA